MKRGVHRNIYLLGIVSFLTDISSEMIFSVFSLFFTTILGASTALLGLIEGLSDFSASSLNYLSGYLSDKLGKRKPFALLGYGFSTLAKIILLIPNSIFFASLFRVIERLGKSFRGPPRDAWISSFTDKTNRGISFGLHKALDKTGALLGPLIAYFLLLAYGEGSSTFRLVFFVAIIPAILSVLLLSFLPEKKSKPELRENIFKNFKHTSKGYKKYLYSAILFSLAYFSFSFLLLKAYSVGFEIKQVILLYLLFNLSFVISAPLIGKLGDYIGRKKIIMLGYLTYLLMSLGFIFAKSKSSIIILFLIFGIFYAIDESQSKAYIIDLEKKKRATALGMYSYLTGLVYLPASLIAGLLWRVNPDYAFGFAALISLVSLFLFRREG